MCPTSLNSSLCHYRPPLLTLGSSTFLKTHPSLRYPDTLPVLFLEVPAFFSRNSPGVRVLQVTSALNREPSAKAPASPHQATVPSGCCHLLCIPSPTECGLSRGKDGAFLQPERPQHLWAPHGELPEMVTRVLSGCFPRLCSPLFFSGLFTV